MPADSFLDFVLEQLAGLGDVRCKRLFGGHGLYSGEIFFGIVFDGRLYFKTNPDILRDFMACNAPVFTPSKKQVLNNYREVTVDILEDGALLTTWARKAAQS